jgi:DNA ligase (NAD+)
MAAQLVAQLRAAADAYYNGGKALMDDDTYDALVERLREMDPKNPFLAEIGAPPPAEGAVTLPHPMPSLDKIKPGQDVLGRFLAGPGPFLLSEKLDGLSALWVPATRRLYLRGDGQVGQDISHLVGLGIVGLKPVALPGSTAAVRGELARQASLADASPACKHAVRGELARQASLADASPACKHAVRGELVVPRATVKTLARSWVNGVIHQKVPVAADVARIRFVAYDLLEPKGLTRSQGFTWLANQGYELPWHKTTPSVTEADLAAALMERRAQGTYDTDGIVVAYDTVPVRPAAGKNPKDCVAFKMPLADQSAVTTLEEVVWKPSAQGFLIPTLRFQPVEIGGARIEFCTGHNARTVVDKGLGPGAVIRIRRSGDVIPTLDAVLMGAAGGASLPAAGTWRWQNDDETGATHICATTATEAQTVAQLQHFFKTVGVASMGPANCEALVRAGLRGPGAIAACSAERLGEVVGPKTGVALYANLRTACANVTEVTLMMASSCMPRGVGESKLKALLEAYPDWTQWGHIPMSPPAGWTVGPLTTFLAELPKYKAWRNSEMGWLIAAATGATPSGAAAPSAAAATGATPSPAPSVTPKGTLCFTGFREKDLEARATTAGFSIAATLSSKVTILVTPDPPKEAGAEKLAKARAAGTKIMSRAEFVQKFLGN